MVILNPLILLGSRDLQDLTAGNVLGVEGPRFTSSEKVRFSRISEIQEEAPWLLERGPRYFELVPMPQPMSCKPRRSKLAGIDVTTDSTFDS
jgi:hypothetical protein